MALLQIICDVHSTNLRIYFLLESNKKEALVNANNDINHYQCNIFIHKL